MVKLTMFGAASLGISIFGIALISEASSTGSVSLAASNPVVQVVPKTLGATANYAVNLISIAAEAAEPAAAFSLSNLLRVDERIYDIAFDTTVSSEVLSYMNVRKIEYGRESVVSVITTPTGTYSTDGLASPHVQYPGIIVSEISGTASTGTPRAGGFSIGPGASFCVHEGSFTYCN